MDGWTMMENDSIRLLMTGSAFSAMFFTKASTTLRRLSTEDLSSVTISGRLPAHRVSSMSISASIVFTCGPYSVMISVFESG